MITWTTRFNNIGGGLRSLQNCLGKLNHLESTWDKPTRIICIVFFFLIICSQSWVIIVALLVAPQQLVCFASFCFVSARRTLIINILLKSRGKSQNILVYSCCTHPGESSKPQFPLGSGVPQQEWGNSGTCWRVKRREKHVEYMDFNSLAWFRTLGKSWHKEAHWPLLNLACPNLLSPFKYNLPSYCGTHFGKCYSRIFLILKLNTRALLSP